MKCIINEKIKKNKYKNVKNVINFLKSDYVFFTLLLLFALPISFFMGKISVIYDLEKNKKQDAVILEKKEKGKIYFVASKNGKVYHLPWCFGANKLSKKNKVIFKTKEDAEKKGYRAAKNCEGL